MVGKWRRVGGLYGKKKEMNTKNTRKRIQRRRRIV